MARPLRALIIEDNPQDAELLRLELRRAGYSAQTRWVDSVEGLREALNEPWDIIYSDFQLIGFDAMGALDVVRREKGSDVPFVVISGTIGEDAAVDVMRAGADDYFRKEHLERLAQATARSLRESEARRKAESAERRALEAERKLREEAEAANRLKDEFLLTLSHELRTPLHAIYGWTTLMRRGSMNEEGRARGMETVERAARHLTRLIDELLDVSRFTTGKLSIAPQAVAFAPLVEAAIEAVRPAAEARGIRIDRALETSCEVYADPGRLQQVVWNVLTNAVKFTPDRGAVIVRLACEGSRITLRVSDSGVGIAPEFLPHVFERFRQADGSTTRQYGGLGLGLAIAKDIVELHGGTIAAESEGQGKGATFIIRLPIRGAPATDRPKAAAAASSGSTGEGQGQGEGQRPLGLKNVRVLAVDDDPDSRDLLRLALESGGAVVRPAANAREGLDVLRTWRPQVLVSDIGMPDLNGYEFLRAARAQTAGEGTWFPAIALTAFASHEDAQRATEAGYQVHLPKPVDVERLLHVVEELVEVARRP